MKDKIEQNSLHRDVAISEMPDKLDLNRISYQIIALIIFVILVVWGGHYFFGFTLILIYLCLWFFGSAVMTPIYPRNYIVNSFLLASTTLVSIFSIFKATELIFDYVHIPPMVMAYIVIILNKPVSLKLLWLYTVATSIWYAIVRPIIYFEYPHPVFVALFQLFNAGCITLIIYFRSRKTNPLLQKLGSIAFTFGLLIFAITIAILI